MLTVKGIYPNIPKTKDEHYMSIRISNNKNDPLLWIECESPKEYSKYMYKEFKLNIIKPVWKIQKQKTKYVLTQRTKQQIPKEVKITAKNIQNSPRMNDILKILGGTHNE